MYQEIVYNVEDPVAVITMNRPEALNALTGRMMAEIRHALSQAEQDPAVVGIILTGAGRGFSAGLDSQVLAEVTARETPPENTAADSHELPGIFSYLLEVPKPVIAAVNGVAAGGGLILALLSDLRIASRDASFTTVFLKRGLISEHGSSWLLPRLVGVSRALDLLWMSDRIDAGAARAIGLVDRVVAPEDLIDEARGYIERLAETSPPAAIAETKRLVYRHLGTGYEQALREAEVSQNRFVTAPDAVEGARALMEKRPPRFRRLGD